MLQSVKYKDSHFISIEGIEGAGKSTQIEFISNYFKDLGFAVLNCREPGGTVFGENLRGAILNSDSPITPLAEAHLFASARAQLLSEVIIPALKTKKTVVIADRYIDSSFAYQGTAKGLGVETIEQIHSHAPLNELPNITFYLKIDLQTSLDRQDKRGNEKDYFEKEKDSFHQKLINGFEAASKRYPKRIKVVDALSDIESVSFQIKQALDEYLK